MRTLLLSLLLLPSVAFAHGDSPSFELQQGPYLIDIGYSQEGFRPNEEVDFDFDLFRNVEGEMPSFVTFETIDIRIVRGEEEILAETLVNQKNFIPRLSYTFAEEGDYTLEVAYKNGDSVITEASFDMPVGENEGSMARAITALQYVIAVACIAAASGYIVVAMRRGA